MRPKAEIIVADVPDKEKLIVEIWLENELWVEISQETGIYEITFFDRLDKNWWFLDYDYVTELLREATAKVPLSPSP